MFTSMQFSLIQPLRDFATRQTLYFPGFVYSLMGEALFPSIEVPSPKCQVRFTIESPAGRLWAGFTNSYTNPTCLPIPIFVSKRHSTGGITT